jgi:hypothetical protein
VTMELLPPDAHHQTACPMVDAAKVGDGVDAL